MSERVNLRLTHPTLYRSALVFSLISVGLGLNFLLTKPTFNPFGIDKAITGSIFLMLGSFKLVSVVFIQSLKAIRASMAVCGAWMMLWGLGTSITFFTGQTSLQLFVLYSGLTTLQVLWCFEPFLNPATGTTVGRNADLSQ